MKKYKTCTKCKITKSLKRFSKDKNRKDGLSPWCKYCCKLSRKILYQANKEIFAIKSKKYYYKNRRKILIQCKKYRKSHRSAIKNIEKLKANKSRSIIINIENYTKKNLLYIID